MSWAISKRIQPCGGGNSGRWAAAQGRLALPPELSPLTDSIEVDLAGQEGLEQHVVQNGALQKDDVAR